MSTKSIHKLKIANFKSIDTLEVTGLCPFSVFAGPNGSGKSNFFDALDFVSQFIRSGIDSALKAHGRHENLCRNKHRHEGFGAFGFEINASMPRTGTEGHLNHADYQYALNIHDMDNALKIEELYTSGGVVIASRSPGKAPVIIDRKEIAFSQLPETYSALLLTSAAPITRQLRNIKLYRIDPFGAKESNAAGQDAGELDSKGHNLAAVLNRLQADDMMRTTILEWMEMIVPGVTTIQTEQQALDGRTSILFHESGVDRPFPAHMVSDGTIYVLCLLVAVLEAGNGYGITLIEEPERGLHPKAIRELVGLIRERATPKNPIWLTTHSESVVRALHLDELILVDKKDGRTVMKAADSGRLTQADLAPLGLDEAWLSNLLGGGLPW